MNKLLKLRSAIINKLGVKTTLTLALILDIICWGSLALFIISLIC